MVAFITEGEMGLGGDPVALPEGVQPQRYVQLLGQPAACIRQYFFSSLSCFQPTQSQQRPDAHGQYPPRSTGQPRTTTGCHLQPPCQGHNRQGHHSLRQHKRETDQLGQAHTVGHDRRQYPQPYQRASVATTRIRRFNPLFNPPYMGYSERRGSGDKFKMQGNYHFNDNSELSTTLRLGYSFKQKQSLHNLPVTWRFNKRRNGFVYLQYSNGNRITDSRVLEAIKGTTTRDTIQWDTLGLDYFMGLRLQPWRGSISTCRDWPSRRVSSSTVVRPSTNMVSTSPTDRAPIAPSVPLSNSILRPSPIGCH